MQRFSLIALVGAVTFLGTTAGTFAQTTEQPVSAKADKSLGNVSAIATKNVPSALIAYWLDPKNNARPVVLGDMNITQFGAPRSQEDKGVFTLPGAIEQIVSVDSQSVLFIAGGSREDIDRLKELVDVLDQPLRQVELEAQFVEISEVDLSQFGIDFSDKEKIGFVRGSFNIKLDKLIADGKAKVVSAPRVTTINNLTATISSAVSPTGGTPEWVYNFTPTINGDETITVMSTPVKEKDGLVSVFNVRDGDTVAFVVQSDPKAENNTRTAVVFLTTRIIRRANEKISVAGR